MCCCRRRCPNRHGHTGCFSLTLVGTLLGEMFGAQRGLGYLLMQAMSSAQHGGDHVADIAAGHHRGNGECGIAGAGAAVARADLTSFMPAHAPPSGNLLLLPSFPRTRESTSPRRDGAWVGEARPAWRERRKQSINCARRRAAAGQPTTRRPHAAAQRSQRGLNAPRVPHLAHAVTVDVLRRIPVASISLVRQPIVLSSPR